jgi:hypothetical protein
MDERWITAGACLVSLLLGAWLALALRAVRERARARARSQRAQRGEQRAALVLAAGGFHVKARQQPVRYQVQVDGEAHDVELIIDYLVESKGEQLVAEVKTGAGPITVQNPDTRRQLLEYQLATQSTRVLLVDPEGDEILEVAFPISGARAEPIKPVSSSRAVWPAIIAIAVLIAAVGWFYLAR